jgi:hypothetical protein
MHEEKRRAPRATCDHQAQFSIAPEDGQEPRAYEARVVDVSSLGARIELRGVNWEGVAWIESLTGNLIIDIEGQRLELPSKVVWVKPEPLEAGLFFTQHQDLEFNDAFNELISSI